MFFFLLIFSGIYSISQYAKVISLSKDIQQIIVRSNMGQGALGSQVARS